MGGGHVAKDKWGTKRECGSCGTRFYDLGRAPVVCPKCETKLPATEPVRGVRHVEPTAAKAPPPPKATAEVKPEATAEVKPEATAEVEPEATAEAAASPADAKDEETTDLENEVKAAEKEDFIEDASELGEDEDDMAEVLEGTVEAKESER